jgi:glycosyltransferase involved in cell wall biosynthesis
MKLIYLVTEDWYFYSHRLPMVRGAQRAGFDVCVICNVDKHKALIEKAGVRVIPLSLTRRSLNPFLAARQIFDLIKIYRREKPDLVHHIAMKPVLYGSIAALAARVPAQLNAFAGLGIVFTSDIMLARILRPLLLAMFRILLRQRGAWTLFQNGDDRAYMESRGITDPKRTEIIRGSGVEMEHYAVTPLPQTPPFICAYAGRMIQMKGLQDMYDAFEILRQRGVGHIHLWLCGLPDPGNPQSWGEDRLNAWCEANPSVMWKGHQVMQDIWPQVHLALQPSLGGEGLPKALLEAGACARPMIATDVPGCREVVKNGVNGVLIPQNDPQRLAEEILKFANDLALCARMGQAGRAMIARELSADSVTHEIAHLYKKMILAG